MNTHTIGRRITEHRAAGLTTLRELQILHHLRSVGPTRLTVLALVAECSTAGITSIADKLEKLGHIEPIRTTDRRQRVIGLTATGYQITEP